MIVTPSLAERLQDTPGELRTLLLPIASRVVGEAEAEGLADEAEAWIRTHLADHDWPGNVRELEALRDGSLTADELLRQYCRQVFAQTQSYRDTARRLGLDRRTVRAKLEEAGWTPPRDGDGAGGNGGRARRGDRGPAARAGPRPGRPWRAGWVLTASLLDLISSGVFNRSRG